MFKVLHVVSYLGSGGVETLLYNYYKNMDLNNIQFDFIVHGDEKGLYEEKFSEMGLNIYHVTPRRVSFSKNIIEIGNIFQANKYDIVHVHIENMAFIPLYFAKKYNIQTRISHAHLSNQIKGKIFRKISTYLFKKLSVKYATHYWGCSYDAIHELFGHKVADNNSMVMKNAIDLEKFNFSESSRNRIRQKLNVEDTFVLGHIGKFIYQKNHEFLIDVFREVKKMHNGYKLILVGEGPLEDFIKQKANEYGLGKDILFLGVRDDINDLMCAFDAFVFPSNYEGLGIVLIEAQACSLPCLTSDSVVPQEANVSKHIQYLSLQESATNWALKIEDLRQGYQREDEIENIRKKGYDIKIEAKKIEDFYARRAGFNDGI